MVVGLGTDELWPMGNGMLKALYYFRAGTRGARGCLGVKAFALWKGRRISIQSGWCRLTGKSEKVMFPVVC